MEPREQPSTRPAGTTDAEEAPGSRTASGFAHASEAEFARILDFYQVEWAYEPHVFPILWDLDGNVLESFAPDFYLPDLEIFVELTTLQQRLVRKKNRKVRRLRELYPGLRIKLFYARDFRALMLKYGRSGFLSELSGAMGQVGSHRDGDVPEAVDRLDALDRSGARPEANPAAAGHGVEPRPHAERRSRSARRRAGRRAAAAATHDTSHVM